MDKLIWLKANFCDNVITLMSSSWCMLNYTNVFIHAPCTLAGGSEGLSLSLSRAFSCIG